MPSNRVLIIDDEPNVGASIGRVARRFGYDTIVTTESPDFIDRVRSWHPALVVVDLGMPGLGGTDILRVLGSERCDARIVIVSGFEADAIRAAGAVGASCGLAMAGALQKPLRVEALRRIFEAVNEEMGILTRHDMTDALASQSLFLVYQPKIDVRTRRVAGLEALVRWRHVARGVLNASEFVPLFEEAGFIDELTLYVIDRAVADMRRWRDANLQINVALNMSARSLNSLELDRVLMDRCARGGVALSQITLELTETAAMGKADDIDALARLQEAGVRLSIDDFGTGYSSMVQLQKLPFREMKIDRSFLHDCLTSRSSATIVRAVVDLAHNMGMEVVAEGVESDAVLAHIHGLGCDYAQGFFFGTPLEAAQLPDWLSRWGEAER